MFSRVRGTTVTCNRPYCIVLVVSRHEAQNFKAGCLLPTVRAGRRAELPSKRKGFGNVFVIQRRPDLRHESLILLNKVGVKRLLVVESVHCLANYGISNCAAGMTQ